MDVIHELVFLGVDSLILGLCLRQYYSYKSIVKALKVGLCFEYYTIIERILAYVLCIFNSKTTEQFSIDENLKQYVSQQKDQKIDYAIIRGTVKPIGAPMQSSYSPSVTSVLQVIKIR